ncbi:MAG: sigma factor-like helix-turn-helix DNA-binding protein [Actinomycetota bacterium]|nr:sigma factor-like helix-turn-helix DNA-binding protein [Actinomycetota bacterium]
MLGDGGDADLAVAAVAVPDRRARRGGETVIRAYRAVFVASVERLQQRLRSDRRRAGLGDGVGDPSGSAPHSLPLAERLVLLLVDGHGFGLADAARVLGVAEVTAAGRLDRARAMLAMAAATSPIV